MLIVRAIAFLALLWLTMLAGLFVIEGYELETKVQWVLTITASIILAGFVVFA